MDVVGIGCGHVTLTGFHLGKGHTQYIPQERVKEVTLQLDNYRKIRDLTQEWVTLALELCKLKAEQEK